MTKSTTIRPEEFESHAGSLRRLARHLLRCPEAAEDAVQETWVRASQAPRPGEGKVGGWLRTVLHHVVVSEHRSQSRRSRREAATAERQPTLRRGEVDPTIDLLARREQLNQLTRAVDGLEPELQAVVFLRYFDGLPPRRVASQLGISVEDVHKRLRRAHVRLRKLLDASSAEGQDWRAGMAALFGLPLPVAKASTPLWTQMIERMSTTMPTAKTTALVSAGVVATAALVVVPALFSADDNNAPPATPPSTLASAGDGLDRANAVGMAAAQAARRDVATGSDDGPVDALTELEPYIYELVVHATDKHDLPKAGAPVVLGPANHPLNFAGYTDPDGLLTVRWRGAQPDMKIMLADAGMRGGRLSPLQIASGKPLHVGLRKFQTATTATFSVSYSSSVSASGTTTAPRPITVQWANAEIEPPIAMQKGPDGIQRFVTPTPAVTEMMAVKDVPDRHLAGFAFDDISEEPTDDAKLQIHMTDGKRAATAAEALVVIYSSKGYVVSNKKADENGNLSLKLPPGRYTLRAGGGEYGIATREFTLTAGSTTPWNASLDRGAVVHGSLVDATSGAPLAGWVVRAASSGTDSAWIDQCVTDDQGRFAMPCAPRREHSLCAFAPSSSNEHALLPTERFTVWPDSDSTLAVQGGADVAEGLGKAIVRFDDSAESAAHDFRARLIDPATGAAVEIPFDRHKALSIKHLPPAHNLSLMLGGTGAAWREHSRFEVSLKEQSDLGTATIDAPAKVLIGAADDRPWIAQRRGPVLSRIEAQAPKQLELAAMRRRLDAISGAVAGFDNAVAGVSSEITIPLPPTPSVGETPTLRRSLGVADVVDVSSSNSFDDPEIQEITEEVVEEYVEVAEPAEQDTTVGYLLPAGSYIAVVGDASNRRIVTFEVAAGQELDLAALLAR